MFLSRRKWSPVQPDWSTACRGWSSLIILHEMFSIIWQIGVSKEHCLEMNLRRRE